MLKATVFKSLTIIPFICFPLHAEITTDSSLGNRVNLNAPDYQITQDLGKKVGNNLFHSFETFNIFKGESATFSGDDGISNVISRVTGGESSTIDGVFRNTIPESDTYFINPAGVLFGKNAQLDVQGSFHASTADYLRLGENGRFDARNPSDSVLTVAPIRSFGFLGNQIAPISIQGHGEVSSNLETGLSVPEGKTLSLIGGEIDIGMGTYFKTITVDDEGDESTEIKRLPILSAPSGKINLASVASIGEVNLGEDFMDVSSFNNLANIKLTEKSTIAISGEGGGSIFIRGGEIFIDDSTMEAKTLGSRDGGVIDLQANNVSLVNGAVLNANTESTGRGSDINIQATDSITVAGENNDDPDNIQRTGIYARSGIRSEITDDNLGDGGQINFKAKNISLKDGASISVSSYGGGNGGDVILKASESMSATAGESSEHTTVISASTYSETGGDAGSLLIEARNISFVDGARILSTTDGKGNGGNVTLIGAQNISFIDGAYIDSSTDGKGNGGNITLRAIDSVILESGEIYIYTNSTEKGAGDGGNLLIEAENISLEKGTYIEVAAAGEGNGGHITFNAHKLLKQTGVNESGYGSSVRATTDYSGTGNAGNIFVNAKDILLTDGAYLVSSSFSSGKAGNVHIHATGTITIAGADQDGWVSGIASGSNPKGESTVGGEGGNVIVEANQLIIKDGASISANSIAPRGIQSSRAGKIIIHVQGAVELSGANPYGENEDGFGSGIYVRSIGVEDNAGDAGSIMLQAGSLLIKDGAVIMSSTNNNAQGGNIEIDVRDTVIITGDASHISLKEPASSQSDYLQGFSPSSYNQSTSGIYADSSDETDNAGVAGEINITANRINLLGGSISTSTQNAGGGNIKLSNSGVLYLKEGRITTSVGGGSGDGGNILLKPNFVVMDDSQIIARAVGGNGGEIEITTLGIYKFPPESTSPIDASSQFGVDGEVEIDSPDVDVSSGLFIFSGDFIDASTLFNTFCRKQLTEMMDLKREYKPNSFVVHRSSGSVPSPDDFQGSSVLPISTDNKQVNFNNKKQAVVVKISCSKE